MTPEAQFFLELFGLITALVIGLLTIYQTSMKKISEKFEEFKEEQNKRNEALTKKMAEQEFVYNFMKEVITQDAIRGAKGAGMLQQNSPIETTPAFRKALAPLRGDLDEKIARYTGVFSTAEDLALQLLREMDREALERLEGSHGLTRASLWVSLVIYVTEVGQI